MLDLPEDIASACEHLFEAQPLDRAMNSLLGASPSQTALIENILTHPVLTNRPDLAAALWLYVDDLDRSHEISQSLNNATGSYWHGIMHRREGDFGNSHYWMRRAESHPLLIEMPELAPHSLIDAVSAAHGSNPPELVERQREEWLALFLWCAHNG